MANQAELLEEANSDVERIARALFVVSIEEWGGLRQVDPRSWENAHEDEREHMRRVVRSILIAGLVEIGRRPSGERPMEGQVSLEEGIVAMADRVLVYDDVPPSQNSGASGYKEHWAKGAKVKKAWQGYFEQLLMLAAIPRDGSVEHIAATALLRFPQHRGRDAENFQMVLTKALGDALVNGGWLPDDTPEFYRFVGVTFDPTTGPARTTIGLQIRQKEEAHGEGHGQAGSTEG